MKTIHLPRTSLDVEVEDFVHFHDDGIVDDMEKHSDKLLRRYGIEPSGWPWERVDGCCKRVRVYDTKEGEPDYISTHFHIFVRSNLNTYGTKFCQGHEETHVLYRMDRIDVLKDALKSNGIRSDGLEVLPEEVICDIGGIHALLQTHPKLDILNFNGVLGEVNDENVPFIAQWLKTRGNIKILYGE